ncbi:MAG: glycosyltransferase family A protein, partial [Lacisediminimonas sp.]|nr:glycosyltransferase family A protein [Lacisediminimonas sp.]
MDDAGLIAASGMFDPEWYCNEYPDVLQSGLEPFAHFLLVGLRLLRNPGPRFDCRWYLDANPDVAADGKHPLQHYLRFGSKEGRAPRPLSVAPAEHARKVDVIVPVCNALDHVQRCLAALHAHRDGCAVRVLVINDGSDRDTTAWLREFCQQHQD